MKHFKGAKILVWINVITCNIFIRCLEAYTEVHNAKHTMDGRHFRYRKQYDFQTALTGAQYEIRSLRAGSVVSCSAECHKETNCKSINFKKASDGSNCRLNSATFSTIASRRIPVVNGFNYYEPIYNGEASFCECMFYLFYEFLMLAKVYEMECAMF